MNLLEELDSPGEWYLDRATGLLLFYLPGDLSQALTEVSMLEEPLLSLINAANVIISGLTVEVTRGLGIYMEGGGEQSDRRLHGAHYRHHRHSHRSGRAPDLSPCHGG